MNPPMVNKWLVTASVMIPTLIEILDTSVANVALNHIQGSLSAGQEEVTWVLTSYLVANAVVIPMSGWIARFMGRKRYLLASLAAFTASSMLCGGATSLWQIVLFRIVQGIAGGGLQPMSLAILMETYPPRQRGLAMGIFGMGIVVGPILGPLLGGYFTDNFSWRWIFYINLPIGILALFMIYTFIFDPPYQQLREKGEKVDYIGLALLCVGLGSLQIVLDKGQLEDWFNSDFIVFLSVVAVVSMVLFVFWELRQENPVLDLRIFKDTTFATGNAVLFVGFFSFFGSIVLLPIYLQTLLGYTAYDAGLVLGPAGAISIVILPLVGKATERIDSRFLLGTGLLISAYALYYMSGFNLQIDFETAVMSRVIQGMGMPFFFVSLSFVTMAYVPKERMNNASAIFNLLRNMGGSFGVAFVTTVLARRTQFHQHRLADHLTPYDPRLNIPFNELKDYLATKLGTFADQTQIAGQVIYRGLQREAASLAFNDVFFIQTLLFLGLLGLLWIIRKPPMGRRIKPVEH
jgi:MFS transporter, DHA2 family, multidrug resistance protein